MAGKRRLAAQEEPATAQGISAEANIGKDRVTVEEPNVLEPAPSSENALAVWTPGMDLAAVIEANVLRHGETVKSSLNLPLILPVTTYGNLNVSGATMGGKHHEKGFAAQRFEGGQLVEVEPDAEQAGLVQRLAGLKVSGRQNPQPSVAKATVQRSREEEEAEMVEQVLQYAEVQRERARERKEEAKKKAIREQKKSQNAQEEPSAAGKQAETLNAGKKKTKKKAAKQPGRSGIVEAAGEKETEADKQERRKARNKARKERQGKKKAGTSEPTQVKQGLTDASEGENEEEEEEEVEEGDAGKIRVEGTSQEGEEEEEGERKPAVAAGVKNARRRRKQRGNIAEESREAGEEDGETDAMQEDGEDEKGETVAGKSGDRGKRRMRRRGIEGK